MDRKELKTLIARLGESLRSDIESAKEDLRSARKISKSIDALHLRSSELVSTLIDPVTGVEQLSERGKAALLELEKTQVDAKQSAQILAASLESSKMNIEEMAKVYVEFQATHEKMTDPELGFEAIVTSFEKAKEEVEKYKSQSQVASQEVQSALLAAQENLENIKEAYAGFSELNVKIIDEESGLEATRLKAISLKDEIVAIKSESQTIYTSIDRFNASIASDAKQIEKIKKDSESAFGGTLQAHDESRILKGKIEEILKVVSSEAQSEYFKKRARQIERLALVWGLLFFVSLCVAGWLSHQYLLPIARQLLENPSASIELTGLLFRLGIIAPAAGAAYFALSQYIKERRLAEKYAFKALTAATLGGSVLQLNQSLVDNHSQTKDENIVKIALAAVNAIYQEPVEFQKTSIKVAIVNKFLGIKSEVEQKIEDVKTEVTEVISSTKPKKVVAVTVEETPLASTQTKGKDSAE